MTRQDAIDRKSILEKRREALVDQLTSIDATSASFSAGGGSKSYTNRSVADIKAKIRFIEEEIAALDAALAGNAAVAAAPVNHYVEFNG